MQTQDSELPDDPEDDPEGDPEADQEPERLGYAAYFGAAAGLVIGLILAMLGAAGLDALYPRTEWAERFWSVTSPLLAVLGFMLGGVACHRWMRGQVRLPAVLFFTVLVVGIWLASGPVGFDWMKPF